MSDIDFRNMLGRAIDPQVLKRGVDLAAICEKLGIALSGGEEDGRWVGLCPFHDDLEHPNFSVYETDSGDQRVGCFACDFGPSNDVYDLIRTLRGCGFSEAVTILQELAVARRARA